MNKKNFYGKIENGKLEIYDGEGYRKTLSNMQGEVVISIESTEHKRTPTQNDSLHLWFTQVADILNESGLDMRALIRPEVDISWTCYTVKTHLWKPLQEIMLGKKSTTELDKKEEINLIYDNLNRIIAKRTKGKIALPPFPSIDVAMDRERELENK